MTDQPVEQPEIQVGEQFPDFRLRGSAPDPIVLNELLQQKNVVLATFALAFTGG